MSEAYLKAYKNMLDPDRLPNIMTKKWDPLLPVKKNRLLSPQNVINHTLNSLKIKKLIQDVGHFSLMLSDKFT